MFFNEKEYYDLLIDLINTNSTTGYSKDMDILLDDKISNIFNKNNKKENVFGKTENGTRYVYIKGENKEKTIAISTHCDKVGLMVKSIKQNGTMILEKIGNPKTDSLNCVHAYLITRSNKKITGFITVKENIITFVPDIPSSQFLEIQKDCWINIGDYVFIENNINQTEYYVTSRFLDNSLGVAMSIHLIDFLISNKKTPACSLLFIFSKTEEIGVYTNIPNVKINNEKIDINISKYIALDVGDVNENVKETDVCLLAKDSYAVYDYDTITQILSYAKIYPEMKCSVDVCKGGTDASLFHFYGDSLAKIISFGPPITNMHSLESVHKLSVENTFNLLALFIAK